jgi:ammonium transporter, Amt family
MAAVFDPALLTGAFNADNSVLNVPGTYALLSGLVDTTTKTNASMDTFFTLSNGNLVFLMQAGFAMLTAGSVRSKNTKNVMLKNMMDACLGLVAYYLFGYAFAFGTTANKFIGYSQFALANDGTSGIPPPLEKFFFQWTFSAATASIVSGSVSERINFYAYLSYAFLLVGWVYPVVAHWMWSGVGFATTLLATDRGALDFAGCLVVHMVGGFAGLCGAIAIGPRMGRFGPDGKVNPIPGHSASLITLGTFLLWFGWYGFNPGSAAGVSGTLKFTAARCAVNTTLSTAAAGVATLVIVRLRDGLFDLPVTLNGVIAGLISITACCGFIEPWAAIIVGIVGACFYLGFASLTLKMKIDDPLEAFPLHGGCGIWGALAVGIFSRQSYMTEAGAPYSGMVHQGFLFGKSLPFYLRFSLFGCQCIMIIITAVWVCANMFALFYGLKAINMLRIPAEDEAAGIDKSIHGGEAYPEDDEHFKTADARVAKAVNEDGSV